MKKFIAPEVKVVRYDTSLLCASSTIGVGDDVDGGEIEFDAPGRRRGIFEDSNNDATEKTNRLK